MSRVTHLLNLARSLPPSPIRAPGTPQLSDALQKIITRTFPQSSASTSTSAVESSITATPAAIGSVTSAPAVVGPSEEKAMEGMIASLERIQSNASLKEVSRYIARMGRKHNTHEQYPLGSTTLRPAHDPLYYKRILDGVHRAQKGEGRSWWRRFFQMRGEA
jgi:hypothetical protein